MSAHKMLIVDDDEMLVSHLSRAMVGRGFSVKTAANCEEALVELDVEMPDLAVVDLRMPGESGLTLIKEISRRSPNTKSVVLTGYGSIANAVEAMRLGAINYVTKPADADQILKALQGDDEPEQTPSAEIKRPSLAESEWNHIQKVLADCNGNITHAAEALDIPRRTLQRKLKKRAP